MVVLEEMPDDRFHRLDLALLLLVVFRGTPRVDLRPALVHLVLVEALGRLRHLDLHREERRRALEAGYGVEPRALLRGEGFRGGLVHAERLGDGLEGIGDVEVPESVHGDDGGGGDVHEVGELLDGATRADAEGVTHEEVNAPEQLLQLRELVHVVLALIDVKVPLSYGLQPQSHRRCHGTVPILS